MAQTRETGFLRNAVQVTNQGIVFVSGSTTLMSISSSGAVTTTGVISGSNALSSSFSLNSALLSGTGSVGFATTGAFATASGSVSSRITQIEQVYATTGSNSFRATQSITGSLTVTGQIIAQTLNVQQVTSSIIFSTGSNTFGCDLNNRQTFTGSFYQTGSVAIFSSCIAIGTSNPSAYGTQRFLALGNGAASQVARFTDGANADLVFDNPSICITRITAQYGTDGTLVFAKGTGFVETMRITSAGNVGIGCSCPTIKLSVQDNNTADRFCNIAVFGNSTPSARLYIKDEDGIGQNPAGIYNDTGYGVGVYNLGAGVNAGVKIFTGSPISQRLWINACGIACFSNTICVGGSLIVGSTSTFGSDMFTYNNGGIFFSGGGVYTSGIFQNSAGLNLQTGTTPRVIIQTNGNVQIDNGQLNVPKTLYFNANSTTGGSYGDIKWYNVQWDGNTRGEIVVEGDGALANGRMVFKTGASGANAAERMRIASTGLVTFNCMISAQGGCFSSRADARVLYLKQTTVNTDNIIQFIDHTNTFAWEVVGRNSVFYIYNNYGGNFSMCINPSTNAVHFPGAVSKGSGTFNIEHPLDSKKCTHRLVHSFIEGPQADLIYRGKINLENGIACVNVDCASRMTQGTFEALNRCAQVFTTNESSWDAIRGKLYGNVLVIESENTESQDEISWMVIGERQDKHIKETSITDAFGRIIVEPEVEEQFTCICV